MEAGYHHGRRIICIIGLANVLQSNVGLLEPPYAPCGKGKCTWRSRRTNVLQGSGEPQQDAVVGVVRDAESTQEHRCHGVERIEEQQVGGEGPPMPGEQRLGPADNPFPWFSI